MMKESKDGKVFVADEMKYVVIEAEGTFVIATIRHITDREKPLHKQIVKNFARQYLAQDGSRDVKALVVCGGGKIKVDRKSQKIRVNRKSMYFGRAHLATVTPLLQKAMEAEGLGHFGLYVFDTIDELRDVTRICYGDIDWSDM